MPSHQLNPFNEIIETPVAINARALRTSLAQKMQDTFYLFSGTFFSRKRNHFGLYDYLTLFIPYALATSSINFFLSPNQTDNPISNALTLVGFIATGVPAVILNAPRYLLGSLFTGLCMPFVLASHGLSLMIGNTHKQHLNAFPISLATHETDNANLQAKNNFTNQETLGNYLRKNNLTYEDISVNCQGTTEALRLKFKRRNLNVSTSGICNGCMEDHHNFAESNALNLNNENDRVQVESLIKLNVGGLTNKLYKMGVKPSFFAKIPPMCIPPLQIDTTRKSYGR
ncbi:MAG: hypothetical protein H0W64_09390 [Gammaproteobacteria bacterium]|nr:hypothetical protein [Gammaproteobacteria bacterium]